MGLNTIDSALRVKELRAAIPAIEARTPSGGRLLSAEIRAETAKVESKMLTGFLVLHEGNKPLPPRPRRRRR